MPLVCFRHPASLSAARPFLTLPSFPVSRLFQAHRPRLSRSALLLAALLAAGCVAPGQDPGGLGAQSPGSQNAGRDPLVFAGGDIRLRPPQGYCLAPDASRDSPGHAVAVIIRCPGSMDLVPAIITITFGERGSSEVLKSGAKALSDYFVSPAGRAALARDGSAGSVVVRQTSLAGGAMVMKMVDRSVGEYWRAVLGLKGRLVTIAVTATRSSSLSPDQSRALLDQTMAALRAANPGGAAPTARAPAAKDPQ